ncbi:extended synaptotagmin-3 [Eurytemora carolleeae]|uniref:extended synaptotagmin-3 n=1 Tax=Eurytemora carolleeae TaxID=1294199 RepID=UPI000C78A346|nr:extended synaptotagmin-3 [Eurytemora carolleeae]|eukprot:XP_023332371.1 extended synaptotagmin-3-like [Eurytemora affinis]
MKLILLSCLVTAALQVESAGQAGAAGQDAWFLALLGQLSPRVSEMGTRVLNSRVEPLVQGALATLNLGRKAFKFTRINLGQVRPKITNIRTHSAVSDLNRITMDFDLVYIGDGDIQVSILGVSSGVRNVKLGGRGRLVLSPTMSELPLVGGIQFFFLTKPEIDFDFDGLAKIADLPVIKAKIKEDLLEDLNKHAVYPNRITIPLSWTADPQMIWQPQISGILGVKLRSVKGLPRRGGVRKLVGQDKPDVFGILGVGGQEWRSTVVKNTVEATWEEWYEFPLELLDGHILEINMYDKDHSSKDEFLGYAAIDVKNFMQQPHFLTTQITKGSNSAALGSDQSTPLPSSQPLQSSIRLVQATLQAVPGRKSKYEKLGGEIELEMAWQPLISTPGSATSRLFPGSTEAVLTVFLYSANNLAKYSDGTGLAASHIPSPRASIMVANYTQQSEIARDTQQASFNFGTSFSLQQNWKTQSLTIKLEDTESRKSLGEVQLSLSSLLGSDKTKEIVSLDPKYPSQTITLSAKLRFPADTTQHQG